MKCLHLNSGRKERLALRIPTYEPMSMLIRFLVISVIAVGVIFFIDSVVQLPPGVGAEVPWAVYVIVVLVFIGAAELQILLDIILERFLPVPQKIKLRLFLQVFVGVLFLVVAHRVIMFVLEPKLDFPESRSGIILGVAAGLIFVQMVANALNLSRLTQKWLSSQELIAEMKREKLQMDYNSLQDQLNPHFLFNNLSVLKSLIIYDPEVAAEFTENFTDVYRYVLQSRNKRLVKLNEEIDFIKAYCALHQERLGEGLRVQMEIDESEMDKEIAPLTGQLLIENAIKHNVASKEAQLTINVSVDDSYLVVSNNLNRRTTSYSTHTGLGNLVGRYEMLTEREIVVQYDEKRFEVRVPLL